MSDKTGKFRLPQAEPQRVREPTSRHHAHGPNGRQGNSWLGKLARRAGQIHKIAIALIAIGGLVIALLALYFTPRKVADDHERRISTLEGQSKYTVDTVDWIREQMILTARVQGLPINPQPVPVKLSAGGGAVPPTSAQDTVKGVDR